MKHDAIAWIGRFENDLIDQLLFDDRPRWWFAVFEYLSQNGRVTRILDVDIDGIFDEIKECLEAGISIAFGGLFVSVRDLGQKGKDFIWGDGFQLSVAKFVWEVEKKVLIILHRVFF